jgi:hypothetical protein
MRALPTLCAACLLVAGVNGDSQEPAGVRFETLDVFIDTTQPLAAWQFELSETTGQMLVVGVENGESDAFGGAPYYDLVAVGEGRADRIVVADFSLASEDALPRGRTRIATLHVQLSGGADAGYALDLMAAGNAAGERIAATLELQQ